MSQLPHPSSRAATLHYTAALLYLATVPKHTSVGLNKVGPATSSIPDSHKPIKNLITPTWLHTNVFLIMSALLSLRWARLGGPVGREEKAIVWLQLLVGGMVGWEYYQHRLYAGLGVLWVAPALSAVAMVGESGVALGI